MLYYPTLSQMDNFCKCSGFIISLLTLYALYSNDITNIKYNIYLIFFQCIGELFICKYEIMIHHLCVAFAISMFFLESKLNLENNIDEIKILLSSEISTLFLVLSNMPMFINTSITKTNQFLFITTFLYTRIYLYTKYILYGKMNTYSIIISFLIYAFYFLNMYWSLLILKKVVKLIKTILPLLTCKK